jgi:hypothetical protein
VAILFNAYVRPAPELTASRPIAQEASVTTARVAAASPKGAISVAVLPFLNLSPDKDQEFFSDGMTEEITATLAKVPDLRVVARTSAFEFKGKNVDIRTMGEQLGAAPAGGCRFPSEVIGNFSSSGQDSRCPYLAGAHLSGLGFVLPALRALITGARSFG